ncbi:hypothetical protein [Herbiconiux sp.]|uniref:hypothetical protein n=1 Tax=Herbiconiux sp. TaxID=1871186 RepID=UPI0025C65D5C|nr:hypothetical protein [Herbiconiux sp.]
MLESPPDARPSSLAFPVPRRAVIAGAVWSAPVVALALAAPAAAASGAAIAFAPSVAFAASRSQTLTLSGTAPDAAPGTLIGIGYPAGFGGPATAAAGVDGSFTVTVRCPVGGNRGVIVAAAPGLRSGSATVTVFPPAGGADEGTLNWSPDAGAATFQNGRWEFPAQTGSVSVSNGRALPTGIALAYPAGYTGPDAVAVTPVPPSDASAPAVTGVFSVEGISAAQQAATSGEIVATPVGQTIVTYVPASAPLRVELVGSEIICACD